MLKPARLLSHFIRLFGARMRKPITIDNCIRASIHWDNGEVQEIEWEIMAFETLGRDIIKLLRYLHAENLVATDKVKISKSELINQLGEKGWTERRIVMTIDFIFSMKVAMIDSGERTDYFYLHF